MRSNQFQEAIKSNQFEGVFTSSEKLKHEPEISEIKSELPENEILKDSEVSLDQLTNLVHFEQKVSICEENLTLIYFAADSFTEVIN